jgi:hypothetical protein
MMSRYVLYPLLIAAFPVVSVYAHNVYETKPEELWAPLAVCVAATLAAWWGLSRWLGDGHRAGLVASLAVALFFTIEQNVQGLSDLLTGMSYYWIYHEFVLPWGPVAVSEVALFGLLTWLAVARVKAPRSWTPALNAFALALVAMPAGSALQALANGPPARKWEAAAFDTSAWSPPPPAQRPDVYYVILDGFARADVLRDLYDFDAGPFLEGLARRGFFVAGRSTSNYSQTRLSLSSSLNADYINNRGLRHVPDEGPLRVMMAGNRVVKAFRRLGYRFISFASGYELTEMTGADEYLTPFSYMSEFHRLLLRMTPLPHLMPTPAQRDAYTMARERVLYALDTLPEVAKLSGPKFVFAHVACPNPPFIFGENGEDVADRSVDFSMFDGDDFTSGSRDDYLRGYRRQVAFLTRKVEAVVDGMLKNSPAPPVIILQADHGPGLRLNHGDPEKTDARERLGILNAYHFPAAAPSGLHDAITPVNAFRLVFNACLGANLELLEERSYLSSWDLPFDFKNATDRVRPRYSRGPEARSLTSVRSTATRPRPAHVSTSPWGSSVTPGCDQEADQRLEQGLAPPPDVMHELEEPQVRR